MSSCGFSNKYGFPLYQRHPRANVCTNVLVRSTTKRRGVRFVNGNPSLGSRYRHIDRDNNVVCRPTGAGGRELAQTIRSPCRHVAMDGMIQGKKFESSPTTVHCATVMRTVDGDERIIMAVSKKDVITLESKVVNDEVDTCRVELNFSNVPSTAEIQSVHCINKSEEFDDFAVGITYAWTTVVDEVKSEVYGFNVYSGFPGSSLETIMENCKTLKLDFLPFLLEHAIYLCETHKKGMWLLSGSDQKIHAYKSDEQQICEQKIEEYFTEFQDINKCAPMKFGTKSFSDYKKRISFYGNNTGILMFAIVDSEKNQILQSFTEHFESPISVLKLFNIHNRTVENINIFSVNDGFIPNVHIINEKEPICFLVGSVIDGAVVYMNVLENYLKKGIILKDSKRYGGIMSSLITDINFDCKNEILIGTEGKYILSYAYKNNRWVKQQPYDMQDHVYTINYLDINGEGVNDVVVMSETGVHIIKHEPKDIIKILKSRLQP